MGRQRESELALGAAVPLLVPARTDNGSRNMPSPVIRDQDYAEFRRLLEESCGIVLGDSKHYLVSSRLAPLMARENCATLGDLLALLRRPASRGLLVEVVDAMTTNETQWFRDMQPFRALDEQVLPELAARGPGRNVSVWSAACSSGQEAYSIAMLIQEHKDRGRLADGRVLATDISPRMIERGRAAVYGASEIRRGLDPERQRRHFTVVREGQWKVLPAVSNRVTFRQHNLLESYSLLGRFDVIFCRNVLIYFSLPARAEILGRMAQALNPGGYLFIGSSEALPRGLEALELVRPGGATAYRRKA